LFTQGMVCHETYKDQNNNWLTPDEVEKVNNIYVKKDNHNETIKVGASESMSKSKKNVIDPEFIIKNYGADSVRLFILSDSPPEKDVQWSDQGMISSFKFVQKFWVLHNKIKDCPKNQKDEENDIKLNKFTNQTINKINQSLDRFSYNTIIASLYEIYNFLNKITENKLEYNNLMNNYEKILKVMMPITPHLASECLVEINKNHNYEWPIIEEKFLKKEIITIVIQVNGKKRDVLNSSKSLNEEEAIKKIKSIDKVKKFITEKEIKKTIYIKDKLINFII